MVGGKNGYNAFSVTGGGINVQTTDLTIQGKIATNTGVRGDDAIVNNGFLDVFATSRGSSLQVGGVTLAADLVGGGRSVPTTPLEHDDGSERQYARIPLTGAAVPTPLTLRNLGDKPASTAVLKVADVTVTEASYDGSTLSVSARATSDAGYPLTVVGVGTLADRRRTEFPMSARPATVTVKSATASPVTYPVTITGGLASDPALPPIDPEPAGPPVNDNTPNIPNSPSAPVATVAAIAPTVRGASVTLDASVSTGASNYAWTQVGGQTATITGGTAAKPTITLPYLTATTATVPAAAADPILVQVTVTNAAGRTNAKTVEIPVLADALAISAGARTGSALSCGSTGRR